jgi:hypothetical protein
MGPVRAVVVGALVWASGGCRQVFGLDPPTVVDGSLADRPFDSEVPCLGTGIVFYCPPIAPTQSVTLSGTLDTDADPRCVIDNGNCVIAGDSITIGSTFRAEGMRPIVLVAVTTIDITATLDVGSHRTFVGLVPFDHVGAGEATGASCGAAVAPTNDGSVGAGGGAGGTFGGRGGKGAPGGGGATGGLAPDVIAPGTFRGGCAGSRGGDAGGVKGGAGGHGGGAVYLIADTINVSSTGAINAGGQGGYPGNMMSGGGGAGAGGFIGLDANTVNNAGAIFANGGGGGEGGGANAPGDYGASSTSPTAAAGGGSINANGGDGGSGSFGTSLDGSDGKMDAYGGGGGGGGAGMIQVFGVSSIAGVVMPPPIVAP